jgi:hypothetical protein
MANDNIQGKPRYASKGFVAALSKSNSDNNIKMNLAAHLCGERVNEVLRGDSSFVDTLTTLGFRRVQVNATKVNGVDKSNISEWPSNLLNCITATPALEWILQCNDETMAVLVQPILGSPSLPGNVSILYDASCGTGVLPSSFPPPMNNTVRCGYAGGMGASNISQVLQGIATVTRDYPHSIWVDMESSLRAMVADKDVFSLDACNLIIGKVQNSGFVSLTPLEGTNNSADHHSDVCGDASSKKSGMGCPMPYITAFMIGLGVASIAAAATRK